VTTDADRPLLDVLREDLKLTGTHFGCGLGECGACSVLVDGKRAFSCSTFLADVDGKSVTTIEGLAGDTLHPLQQAFMEEGAYQCGYCVSGMIMRAAQLLNDKPKPSDDEIREAMNGNLCRCCGYERIVAAVKRASGQASADANHPGRAAREPEALTSAR
jgi:aerobic-type carbon monoxide dehydrogenase small subunit (CoxS/CutS family)